MTKHNSTDGVGGGATGTAVTMTPMEFDDGRKGWYIDHPEFYCDVEPDPKTGAWTVFFKDKEGSEGYGERNAAGETPPPGKLVNGQWEGVPLSQFPELQEQVRQGLADGTLSVDGAGVMGNPCTFPDCKAGACCANPSNARGVAPSDGGQPDA